jgi:hypothetical protein
MDALVAIAVSGAAALVITAAGFAIRSARSLRVNPGLSQHLNAIEHSLTSIATDARFTRNRTEDIWKDIHAHNTRNRDRL